MSSSYVCPGLVALNCAVADPLASNIPLVRLNSGNCRLDCPIIGHPVASSYGRAMQVDAGSPGGLRSSGRRDRLERGAFRLLLRRRGKLRSPASGTD